MNSYKPKIRQLRRKGLIARNINLPRQIRQRKTNILLYCLYVESKNMLQMNLFTKWKLSHRCRKQTYGYQGGKRGDKLGDWD